jgi:hypothetical protein
VLDYLGRYTHRVALSNDRLVDHRDGDGWFRWKHYADHDRVKMMTLEANEFLRRFLLHVVLVHESRALRSPGLDRSMFWAPRPH